jgi:spore coat polysaccharide biosynthesis protein SpsF (cytidylyltransferase family)
MDVQVFPTAVLAEVDRLTDAPQDREHVSSYICEHPECYAALFADPDRREHTIEPDADGTIEPDADGPAGASSAHHR